MNRSRLFSGICLLLVALFGCTTAAPPPEPLESKRRRPAADAPGNPTANAAAAGAGEAQPLPVEPTYSYDPGGRRDPFVSPMEKLEEERGPRPPGIAGMSVDDLDLTGCVSTPDGAGVAYLTGSDGKGYMLRVGDRIYSARVLGIDCEAGRITFLEQVDDPQAIKPTRERALSLIPGE